ncbi:MAG: dTDP-4-dehydrorhamnose reductase [bacterium]
MIESSNKVAVLGASGMLGQSLVSALTKQQYQVFPLDIEDLDIADLHSVKSALTPINPDVIVNAAAYTDVDGCETRKELAFDVNGRGAGNAADVAAALGSLMIQISTDYIFHGDKDSPYLPDDKPGPISIYGESKLFGEDLVRQRAPDHLIIRSSWLFGPGGKNFVDTMLSLAEEQKTLKVVKDQQGSPTCSKHLANAIVDLIIKDLRGTHHLTNSGTCSWYEFAKEIFKQKGIDKEVQPVSSSEFPRPARRPVNSVLDCSSAYKALGKPLPQWKEALSEYLHSSSPLVGED